jgi:hypothetical protein
VEIGNDGNVARGVKSQLQAYFTCSPGKIKVLIGYDILFGEFMDRIANRNITDKTITLDNYEFVDCEFVNCILVYRGGFCILNGVRKVNCVYSFQGPAWNTIAFLQSVGLLDLERSRMESCGPTSDPD